MDADNGDADEESGYEERSDGGEEDDKQTGDGQDPEGLLVGEGAAEEDEGLVGRAEEVEEEPGGEESEEDKQRERVREEREGEDESDSGEVVDAEVGVVLPHAEGGLGEGFRLGEGGAVGELRPGTTLGETLADRVGDVVYEGAEGRGGDWGLGLGLRLGFGA